MLRKKFFSRLRLRKKPEPVLPPLSPKARKLLEILQSRARNGEVEVSYKELMAETGWSRVTISRALKEAQAAGLLEWARRTHQPNRYRLSQVYISLHQASQGHSRPPLAVAANREAGDTPPGDASPGMLQPTEDEALLGREAELAEVERLASKGANCLVLGFDGMGKTHFLKHLSKDGLPCDELIHFSTPSPAKDFLLCLAEELHRRGDLAGSVEVEEFEKALGKLKLRELFKLCRDSLAKSRKRYLLLIDNLDQITPLQKPMMQELLELRNVQVIATAKTEKPRYASLWHHFFTIELSRLPREASDAIVERFLAEHSIPVAEGGRRDTKELLKERLYRRSRGNPRDLFTLLRKLKVRGYVDREYLHQELGAGEEHEYIDMTWIVIMTAAIIMAARYLGLGFHDRELYVLAGVSYAAMLLIRWLSYRWRR